MEDGTPQRSNHFRLTGVRRLTGVVAEDIPAGGTGSIQIEGFLYSDQPEFYKAIDQFSNVYLPRVLVDSVSMFLVIHHVDESVDVHLNEVPTVLEILAKRDVQAGQGVRISDMADIRAMRFQGISFASGDNVVFCFKRGWKFGLYYNFRQSLGTEALDRQALELTLGACYKYLAFQEEYSVLEQADLFQTMLVDGWFPFVQLIGAEFRQLARIYRSNTVEERTHGLEDFLARFGSQRVTEISERWWKQRLFAEHRDIIRVGVGGYTAGTSAGYVTCIKTLHSEIDGILRRAYVTETEEPGGYRHCVKLARRKAEGRFSQPMSLGFPDKFANYLESVFLAQCDILAADLAFSRHSTLHGVARPADYTQARALQAILILDQLYFTLQEPADLDTGHGGSSDRQPLG